jgi:hypothetical protein
MYFVYNTDIYLLYITQHTTDTREEHVSAGFGPTIPVIKRLQTHVLERTATSIGH